MSNNRKKHCPHCDSSDVLKWGSKSAHQRFRCKACKRTFVRTRLDISIHNRQVWFRQWVEQGHTIDYISKCSGYSERTLKRYFYDYLHDHPTWHIRPADKVNMLIDGTYFANKVCLVLYQDNNVKATQLYRLTDGEWQSEISEDLNNLLSLGIRIESVTCDGSASIIKAVRMCAPKAILQRCTVHVQRECLTWLTRYPKSEAGRELRRIVCHLNSITDRQAWGYWVVELVRWEERHREYLNQKTMPDDDPKRVWFTHKMVRRAFVHIKRALPNLFHYLDNPDIPKSTNSLESFFGHLKTNLRLHRGLSQEHFKNYVKWYLFFKNNKPKYKK
jgi:AraC-like DNA-binding protein